MTQTKYIGTIRNPAKRAYAEAYRAWLSDGADCVSPKPKQLGAMAAQSVRMRLAELAK